MTNPNPGIDFGSSPPTARKSPQSQSRYQSPGVNESVFDGLDFEEYNPNIKTNNQSIQDTQKQDDIFEGLDFQEYQPAQEEGIGGKIKRGAARTIPRVVETLAGLPGDVTNLIKGAVTSGLGLVVGDERAQKARETSESIMQSIPGFNLPGSQDIRENVTQKLTGDYLEPQTEYEELYDNVVSDIAALAIPIKGKIPFVRSIGTALLANLGAQGVKELGGGEKTQIATKLGTILLTGMLGRGGAKSYVSKLHDEANALIPSGETVEAGKLITDIDKMNAVLRKGGVTPSKTPVLNLSRQLIKKIQLSDGELPVDELPAFRRSINELRFDRNLSPKTKFYLDRFDDVVSNELMDYGKENPAFLAKYKEANLGTAGLAQSNRIARAISKKVDVSKLSPETALLFGLHVVPSGAWLPIGIGASAAKGAQILNRFTRNNTLQKYYLNSIKASLKGNTADIIRNVEGLDRELKKI